MRKRNIKTVAHWVIMCFLLLFPIVLVGISAFANDEQSVTVTEIHEYETNEVNSNDDLIEGNIYKVNGTYAFGDDNLESGLLSANILFIPSNDDDSFLYFDSSSVEYDTDYIYNYVSFYYEDSTITLYIGDYATIYLDSITFHNVYFVIYNLSNFNAQNFITLFSSSDYLGNVTTTVDIENSNYKQEINNWANSFKRLPVNAWYGQLLDVIGIGDTNNSVMNVIYVYPLYVLWVYLIDLILDCLLVIVNLGHNALKRLDGDIE